MKVLANDGISQAGIEAFEAAGISISAEKVAQEDLPRVINEENYTALLVRSATTVREDLISACPSLQVIGRGGVGLDNIDVDFAKSKGIEVVNTPAASSQSVAELVMGHLFTVARNLHDSNRRMPAEGQTEFKALKKKYGKGFELRGKTMGIVGFGRIGQSLASYALGCGMKVVACDIVPGERHIQVKVPLYGDFSVEVGTISFEEVLRNSDIISLHVPKQSDGTPVIGEKEIQKMKDGVVLANASRGGVIEEDALLNALNSGKVRAAALDVFENEPVPRQDLLSHPSISLTPHTGAATLEAQDRIGTELAEKVSAFLKAAVR